MSAGTYVCEACKRDGKDIQMPVDKAGAALMQQHLKSEHHVKFAGQLKDCPECGYSVLTALDEKLSSCKDHL